MNTNLMLAQSGVTISDLCRLTGLNRATIRRYVISAHKQQTTKTAVIDDMLERMRTRWNEHFPVRRRAGETEDERLARLQIAFGLPEGAD